MESPIKLTGQGIRDLNNRGPKKKPAAPAEAVESATEGGAVDATAVEGEPIAVVAPVTEDATTPVVVNHG